jgi:hypothetical protein
VLKLSAAFMGKRKVADVVLEEELLTREQLKALLRIETMAGRSGTTPAAKRAEKSLWRLPLRKPYAPLIRATPEIGDQLLIQAHWLFVACWHRDPGPYVGQFVAHTEWNKSKKRTFRSSEQLKGRIGQRFFDQTDSNSHRLTFDEPDEMLDLDPSGDAPFCDFVGRQVEAPNHPEPQPTLDFGQIDEFNDAEVTVTLSELALIQNTDDLVDLESEFLGIIYR